MLHQFWEGKQNEEIKENLMMKYFLNRRGINSSNKMTLVTNTVSLCSSLLLIFCALFVPGSTHERSEPEFDVLLPNLTIKLGSDAAFTCIVKHLGEYKVAWIRSEDKAIIALHNHMVTHNHRFSVTHNGHNTWTLHIKTVQQDDGGSYMCQINTDPQRSIFGTLDVVVPADIVDEETSNDVIVAEGQSATLKCKATGYPLPKVKWRRQDGHPLPISKEVLSNRNPMEKIEVWEGETLPMRALTRSDNGPFLCIANNSVPPLVSKRVMVFVHFHPLIKVSNQLVAAPAGINVTLECYVEAVPRPAVSWFNKENQPILNKVGKIWQETEPLKDYSMKMKLTIANLRREDFTDYNCTVGNSIGSAYAIIKLQQLHPPPTIRTTTTNGPIDWRNNKHGNFGKHNNNLNNDRDSNGNPIKHSNSKDKSHKRKPTRNNHDEYDVVDGAILIENGLTTSSSLSSGSATKNQDESSNRRLDNPKFPGEISSSSTNQYSLKFVFKKNLLLTTETFTIQALCLPQVFVVLPLITSSILLGLENIMQGIIIMMPFVLLWNGLP